MKVRIKELAKHFYLNPEELVAFAVKHHNEYDVFDYEENPMLNAKTTTWHSDELVADFKKANNIRPGDRYKLHEDVTITDPTLAQQYANGQAQLINKDKGINALQMQINNLEKQKNEITKAMATISQKAAQDQKVEEPANQPAAAKDDVATKTANAAAAAAVAASQASNNTSESLLIKINEEYDDWDKDQLNQEIERLSDEIIFLKNKPGSDRREISNLESKLAYNVDHLNALEIDEMNGREKKMGRNPNWVDDESGPEKNYWIDPAGGRHYDDEEDPAAMYEADEPVRFGNPNPRYLRNEKGTMVRQMPAPRAKGETKPRPWSDTKWARHDALEKEIEMLEEEIRDLKEEIGYEMDKFESPKYNGISGEIENFFGEIGFEAADVLNSGGFKNDKEKLKALAKVGVKDPKGTLENFYYYYPEFDPSLVEAKKRADKEILVIQSKIDKIQKNLDKKEQKLAAFESYNPMSIDKFYDLSEAFIERENEESKEDYLDDDYVFYVKINDNDNEFIAKIFKMSPDGEWYGVVKKGEDKSFEHMSYDSEYDELDIVEFLKDNYEEIEIIDIHEFNEYIEDDIEDEYDGDVDDLYDEEDDLEEGWPSNML